MILSYLFIGDSSFCTIFRYWHFDWPFEVRCLLHKRENGLLEASKCEVTGSFMFFWDKMMLFFLNLSPLEFGRRRCLLLFLIYLMLYFFSCSKTMCVLDVWLEWLSVTGFWCPAFRKEFIMGLCCFFLQEFGVRDRWCLWMRTAVSCSDNPCLIMFNKMQLGGCSWVE